MKCSNSLLLYFVFHFLITEISSTTSIAFLFSGSIRSFILPFVYQSIYQNLILSLCPSTPSSPSPLLPLNSSSFNCSYQIFMRISLIDNILNGLDANGAIVSPISNKIDKYLQNALSYFPSHLLHYKISNFGSPEDLELYKHFTSFRHQIYSKFDKRRYSMYINRWGVYQMMLNYEILNNYQYDYVIHTRLDVAWFAPVPPLNLWYHNDAERSRVVIHDRWAEFVSDTFAVLPRRFADDYYSMDVLLIPGIMCLGGPNFDRNSLRLSSILSAGSFFLFFLLLQ